MLSLKLLALVIHWENVVLSQSRKYGDSVLARKRQETSFFLIEAGNEREKNLFLEQARNRNLKFTLVSNTETRNRSTHWLK